MTTQASAPASGSTARLTRRGVVSVGGPEAEKFLNDLVTADIAGAGPGRAVYSGLLTPQGKVLFDFIVFRDGDFLVDLPRDKVSDFIRRLTFYRLRAKVELADRSSEMTVTAGWKGAPVPPAFAAAPDPRLPELGWRALVAGGMEASATEAAYDAHRIALGIPEGGLDFPFGDTFPHDADMDQLHGIDFDKGCYVGQEVVSRMEHRSTARRRVVVAHADAPLPAPGSDITAGGRPVGTLGSSADGNALALLRLDRAKEAMDKGEPLLAGGSRLTLSIPPWAGFAWPTTAAAEP